MVDCFLIVYLIIMATLPSEQTELCRIIKGCSEVRLDSRVGAFTALLYSMKTEKGVQIDHQRNEQLQESN